MTDKVVITGFSLVSSLGHSASETWNALLSGGCGIRPIEDFDVQGFKCKAAARVHGLSPLELGIHHRDARIMDKHSLMLMKCSQDAFKNSMVNAASVPGEDIGFFAAMGMVDYNIGDLLPAVLKSSDPHSNLNYAAFYSSGYQEIYPLWPLSMLNNISFCQVAVSLGIKGENTVFSPHADSATQAIIEGVNTIIEKKAQLVLAGGVSEKVSPLSLARASWSGILNDAGGFLDETLCRPFGKDRKGTIIGEGCGIVTLESLSSARKRQAPYFAAITGYACAFGKNGSCNCPTSGALSNAMEHALFQADLKPSDIDLIIAHGDGTHMGDKNEIEAIHHTFSNCISKINVFSSKGAVGNLLAGAPAVDIILGICMLRDGIIPTVCNALPLDENIQFKVISKEPLKKDLKRILINASSCEGQCASLIIEAVN
jgi:3-oxoacyl-[acyl-carrier-protein] synthase II